jgi:hypothetical protein
MPPIDPNHVLLIAIRDELTENTRKTNQLLQAFPSGDIDGHRRYHESVIEWRELRNKMVREALIHAAKAGSLGAMGWLAYAVWQSFIITVRQ